MRKGDELTLIGVQRDFTPGRRFKVLVQDFMNGVITVSYVEELPGMNVVAEELMEGFYLKVFLASVKHTDGSHSPAIFQLRPDTLMDTFFSDECLKPQFNGKNLKYEYGLSYDVLQKWVQAGILDSHKTNSYFVCPMCQKAMSVRIGCRNCMSGRVESKMLIRHVDCGYIGYGRQFDNWMCPSCEGKLVQGGYDSMKSPPKCDDCGFVNDSQPHYIGTCLGCRGIFHLRDCVEAPVISFSKREPVICLDFLESCGTA